MQIEKIEVGDYVANRPWTPQLIEHALEKQAAAIQALGLDEPVCSAEDFKKFFEDAERKLKPIGLVIEIMWSERGNTETALILGPDGHVTTQLVTNLKKVGQK